MLYFPFSETSPTLVAADYGAPTTRKRLFLVARCDGRPIVWPEQTHFKNPAEGQSKWRSAAECIDWSVQGKSIFEREKPLADATMRRIAKGIKKLGKRIKWLILPLHESETDRHLIGLSG